MDLLAELVQLALGEGYGVEGEVDVPTAPADLVPELGLLPAHRRQNGLEEDGEDGQLVERLVAVELTQEVVHVEPGAVWSPIIEGRVPGEGG